MPERGGGVGEHPSVEVLSAYVDGTLDVRERSDVETHVAACEDCYELVTEVVATEEDIDAEGDVASPVLPSPKVVPFTRRTWLIGAAAGLAAAAALVLAVRLGSPSRQTDAAVGKLVAAVGDQRLVEARLSGGFRYGPVVPPLRSGAPSGRSLALLEAVAELERSAQTQSNAATSHALGVGLLLADELDRALVVLNDASLGDPRNAGLLNDLGAAYLTRAQRTGAQGDWSLAADAFARALAEVPDYREALFNQALVETRSGDRTRTASAWRAYLAADQESPWSAEARRQLALVQP